MSTNTLTEREEAEAAILKRMVKKRASKTKQLNESELSQVVPVDSRDMAKEVLKECVQDPNSPITEYQPENRNSYRLRSLEEAAQRLEDLTGERINYRQYTHSLSEPEDPVEISLALEWDHLETVKRVLENHDAATVSDVDYDHPPTVTATIQPDQVDDVRQTLRDETNGAVP